jgi:tetratricopeptide (TPR) repeat protein
MIQNAMKMHYCLLFFTLTGVSFTPLLVHGTDLAIHPFYAQAFQEGQESIQEQAYEQALESFKIAEFGFLNQPPLRRESLMAQWLCLRALQDTAGMTEVVEKLALLPEQAKPTLLTQELWGDFTRQWTLSETTDHSPDSQAVEGQNQASVQGEKLSPLESQLQGQQGNQSDAPLLVTQEISDGPASTPQTSTSVSAAEWVKRIETDLNENALPEAQKALREFSLAFPGHPEYVALFARYKAISPHPVTPKELGALKAIPQLSPAGYFYGALCAEKAKDYDLAFHWLMYLTDQTPFDRETAVARLSKFQTRQTMDGFRAYRQLSSDPQWRNTPKGLDLFLQICQAPLLATPLTMEQMRAWSQELFPFCASESHRLYLRGKLAQWEGRDQKALEYYWSAIEKQSPLTDAYLQCASLYIKLDRPHYARYVLRHFEERFPEELDLIQPLKETLKTMTP